MCYNIIWIESWTEIMNVENQEKRMITGIIRYLQEHLAEEISLNILAEEFHLSSLSIGEISNQCGYGDYRVFTKAFKKVEGSTPLQYRRNFWENLLTSSGL